MTYQIRIHDMSAIAPEQAADGAGNGHGRARTVNLACDEFWIGAGEGEWEVSLPFRKIHGPLAQVRRGTHGLELRVEPGLPIEASFRGAELPTHFLPLLDGDPLILGDYRLEIHSVEEEPEIVSLDSTQLLGEPGGDLVGWFESVMSMADRLEGVNDFDQLAGTAMEAVLACTSADRVFLCLDVDGKTGLEWFLSRMGGSEAFGVSRSLVDQVRKQRGVVFVPDSAHDPMISGLSSIRREGIHSSLVVPLRALGRSVGVLYVDCVKAGNRLASEDFQKAALLGRMLAGAIGNRDLVKSVLQGDSELPTGLRSNSRACKDMIEKARLFAPTDYTILIRGETGSGKEVLAHALHAISKRSKGPFVPVNCAAIPAALMESELFGHVKGSFTGASEDREGFFTAATGGSLFLDEIGDMELELQAKILRALERREVTPVGSSRPIAVSVRILAATHRNLEEMVSTGEFREDLYYRLKELEIRIPPLRDRHEDILVLAESFLLEAAKDLPYEGKSRLSPDAVRKLLKHAWRGNVRELKHAMRTSILRAGGAEILPEHLELLVPGPRQNEPSPTVEAGTWKDRLERQEREALEATFEQAGGNLTKAALLFGLPRTTYRERLVRHGLL